MLKVNKVEELGQKGTIVNDKPLFMDIDKSSGFILGIYGYTRKLHENPQIGLIHKHLLSMMMVDRVAMMEALEKKNPNQRIIREEPLHNGHFKVLYTATRNQKTKNIDVMKVYYEGANHQSKAKHLTNFKVSVSHGVTLNDQGSHILSAKRVEHATFSGYMKMIVYSQMDFVGQTPFKSFFKLPKTAQRLSLHQHDEMKTYLKKVLDRRLFGKNFKPKKLLQKVLKGMSDGIEVPVKVRNQLLQYSKKRPSKAWSTFVYKQFKALDAAHHGRKFCQTLLFSMGRIGESKVLKTTTTLDLKKHFLNRVMELQSPSLKIASRVFSIYIKGKKQLKKVTPEKKEKIELLVNTAILTLGHLSKFKFKRVRRFFKKMHKKVKTIVNQQSLDDNLFGGHQVYFHAIANAKHAVPLSFYKSLVNNPKYRSFALRSLSQRAVKEEPEVDSYLLSLLLDRSLDRSEKYEALVAYLKRTSRLGVHSSKVKQLLSSLKHYYHKYPTHALSSNSLSPIYHAAGVFLSKHEPHWKVVTKNRMPLTDSEFIDKIKEAVKVVTEPVADFVVEVSEKAKAVFDFIEKGVVDNVKKLSEIGNQFSNQLKEQTNALIDALKSLDPLNLVEAQLRDIDIFDPVSTPSKSCTVLNPRQSVCAFDWDMRMFHKSLSRKSLDEMKYDQSFVYEKLLGADKLNFYVGASAYAGTNVGCGGNPNAWGYKAYFRGLAKARLFTKEIEIADASYYNTAYGSTWADNMYFYLFDSVRVSKPFYSLDASTCQTFTSNILDKDFPNILEVDYLTFIGIVPVQVGLGVNLRVDMDMVMEYCHSELKFIGTLKPNIQLGVYGYGAIPILISAVGISLEVTAEPNLNPKVSLTAATSPNCQVCTTLPYDLHSKFNIKAFAEIEVPSKTWEKVLFSKELPKVSGTFYNDCQSFNPEEDDLISGVLN